MTMSRYAAKAIFEFSETYRDGRPRRVFFEVRFLNVMAKDEGSAVKKLFKHCERDQWTYSGAEIKLQRQRFLGLADIDNIDILEPNEVWFEYVDDWPVVKKTLHPRGRARRTGSAPQ
jgi:hypothetical protein